MLNKITDKTFLITTINSNRKNYIKKHLKDNNIKYDTIVAPYNELLSNDIEIVDNVASSKSSLSLVSAYMSIFEKSILEEYNDISIIEDDCYFSPGWESKFSTFYKNVPTNWNLLNIGYHPLHESHTVKEKLNDYVNIPLNYHHTTHCIIVNWKCYKEFLYLAEDHKYKFPVDYIFNDMYKNKNRFYSYIPNDKFIYQLSVRPNKEYDLKLETDIRFKSFITE